MIEFFLSTGWAFAVALSIGLWLMSQFMVLPPGMNVSVLLPPSFTGMVLAMVCLLQFLLAVLIDRRYEPMITRSLYWIIWYPFVYWIINLLTSLVSFPKVMLRIRRQRARWTSPDRGIKELT